MSEIAEFTRHLGHYLQPPDVALVERAFAFSEHAHQGQFRKSGEPYITHPLAVASILSQWRLDAQGLAAALLHDVMEDTNVTKTEIESSFGKPVADMVDGVSKGHQIRARQPARGDEPHSAIDARRIEAGSDPRYRYRPGKNGVQRVQENAREALLVLAGIRHLRRAGPGQGRHGVLRGVGRAA